MSSLIIVESFSKSKTIGKYLDNSFTVTYSSGHICDLPKKELGINTDDWTTVYKPTNTRVIKNIRTLVKSADTIYIASDPDIEGEAIAYHIKNAIKDLIKNKLCYRISFNEITKNVVLNAINNPTDINMNIVEAQETRRIVDRLIGYKISPLLWDKFSDKYLSAGRVQIASLIICINQKNKILKKEIIPYWCIKGVFKIANISINAVLISKNVVWKTTIERDLINKFENLKINENYNITYETRNYKTSPLPPYTTTSLQQDAYNKLKYSSKNTMKLAQELYEHGHITYIRTDSVNISDIAKNKIKNYINRIYGDDNVKDRVYKTKIKNAQEAHEAIRITDPNTTTIIENGDIKKEHIALYNLIWKRTIASLMIDAEYTEFNFKIANNINVFKGSKSFLINEGFNKVYDTDNKTEEYTKFIKTLDKKECTSKQFVATGAIDNIPSMYNEVQLIKELESEGIGRPSTYSTTIDKLISKKYVKKGLNPQQNISINSYEKTEKIIVKKDVINLGGKQKDLLIPTELGLKIIEYIFKISPYLCDLKFTSKMEDDMDNIMNKQTHKADILNVLYGKIKNTIEECGCSTENDIIKTKYGYCYYNRDNKKYTNIESYLKWKNKTYEDIDDNDMMFIKSLPKKINLHDKTYYIHLGQYGLYLKDIAGNNLKFNKELWGEYT